MRPFTKISSSLRRPQLLSGLLDECYHVRHVHSSYQKAAVAHPINVRGPPPKAPAPVSEYAEQFERIERQKRQADVIQQDSHQRTKSSSPLKKRFWKDVNVREVPGKKNLTDEYLWIDLTQLNGAQLMSLFGNNQTVIRYSWTLGLFGPPRSRF